MANPKKKTGRKILIFGAILLAIGGLTAYAILRKREPVIIIQTEKVGRRTLTELVRANGKIQPVWQVKISPEVSGEIIELPVKEGQAVKKGDLLVRIKPDFYRASRTSAEASYNASRAGITTAEANLKKTELEFNRTAELLRSKLVAQSQFDEIRAAYDVAKAQLSSATHQVEMARAALAKADEDLSKTSIFSPLTGTITKLNSQLGERVVGTAMMAGTEIMIVSDLTEMEARVDIGENDVVLIALGQTARLEVDAYRDRKFAGVTTEIANSSRTASLGGGTSQEATKFEVKIRIKEKEAFRPGMSVTAEIETRYRTNVLSVPFASVTTRMPKEPEKPGQAKPGKEKSSNAVPSAQAEGAPTGASPAGTNVAAASGTNQVGAAKRPGESPKPIEVIFLAENGKAKMVPVKRGISDDSYTEILEGVQGEVDVVSGGYKAINRELEDGKRIKIGPAKGEKDKKEEK